MIGRLSRREFLKLSGAALLGAVQAGYKPPLIKSQIYRLQPQKQAGVFPNVLLLVMDTVRAASLSLYGYHRETTPNLERLSKSGVRFERAYSTAPWTLPSHASMFTGRWPFELGVDWEVPLDNTYPTLAEILNASGYATAGFVANTEYCSYETGLNRGFEHYEDYPISFGAIVRSTLLGSLLIENDTIRELAGNYDIPDRKNAYKINHDFLAWLDKTEGRPFFAFLNYYDAHDPYLPPSPYDELYGSLDQRGEPTLSEWWNKTPSEVRAELDVYEGAIAYIDDQIGQLLSDLEIRSLMEKTLVIVTSDHGEQFGEHGLMNHANSLYLPNIHVPLLVLYPMLAPEGICIPEPVSLRDLPMTILDLLGIQPGINFPGRSLSRFWDSSSSAEEGRDYLLSEVNFLPNQPEWFPTSRGDMKSLIFDQYHYITNGDGKEELYNLETDRPEEKNLARVPGNEFLIEDLRSALRIRQVEK